MRSAPNHPPPVTPWPVAVVEPSIAPSPATLQQPAAEPRLSFGEMCRRVVLAVEYAELAADPQTQCGLGRDALGAWWMAVWVMPIVMMVRLASVENAKNLSLTLFPDWLTFALRVPVDGVTMHTSEICDGRTEVAGVRVFTPQLVELLKDLEGPCKVARIVGPVPESLWIFDADDRWRLAATMWRGAVSEEGAR